MTPRRPTLGFWQLWNISFGFFGIQVGFALQNANVSRIFQTLGASIDDLPILWIAGPVTGLVVQPIIGYFSDRTWNRLGRRRPYFLAGAIVCTVALALFPGASALWMAAGLLWMLDASITYRWSRFAPSSVTCSTSRSGPRATHCRRCSSAQARSPRRWHRRS